MIPLPSPDTASRGGAPWIGALACVPQAMGLALGAPGGWAACMPHADGVARFVMQALAGRRAGGGNASYCAGGVHPSLPLMSGK